MRDKDIIQDVSCITVTPNDQSPAQSFAVKRKDRSITTRSNPLSGMAYVQPWYSALCGTDGSKEGYYWGGRFHADYFREKEKLLENKKLFKKSGITVNDRQALWLISIPNHEGWGILKKVSPNNREGKRQIAVYALDLTEKKFPLGYKVVDVDFQDLKPGDWVVFNAALRCDAHWKINSQTGFPEPCHRKTEGGHIRKRVPGHLELPGFSHFSKMGLPYPNHMLTKVPVKLREWIEEKPIPRELLLVSIEPLSCCFEAFAPLVKSITEGREHLPQQIAILGDGPNAALLSLVATTIFPNATIYIIGHTIKKLAAITSINQEKIIPITVNSEERQHHGYSQLRTLLADRKLDVVIPTFHVDSLTHYRDLVKKSGRVILWAADEVNERDSQVKFEGVGDPTKLHRSYGGWNQAEWSALAFCETLVSKYPSRLDAVCSYPYYIVDMKEGAVAMQQWLDNRGRFMVEMDEPGHHTSVKIILDHRSKND